MISTLRSLFSWESKRDITTLNARACALSLHAVLTITTLILLYNRFHCIYICQTLSLLTRNVYLSQDSISSKFVWCCCSFPMMTVSSILTNRSITLSTLSMKWRDCCICSNRVVVCRFELMLQNVQEMMLLYKNMIIYIILTHLLKRGGDK